MEIALQLEAIAQLSRQKTASCLQSIYTQS